MTMTTPQTPDSLSTSEPAVPRQVTRQHDRREVRFVAWVEQLCAADPGARSALRTGLRKNLDAVPQMHRFVASWLPSDTTPEDTQRAYYTVASMIAAQPRTALATPAPEGEGDVPDVSAVTDTPQPAPSAAPGYGPSLGIAFARAVVQSPGRDKAMREATAESRLNLLTRQSLPGLHRHLPAAVAYLRACDVPVDWAQLLTDLTRWQQHAGRISRRWLQDYYRLREKDTREAAAQRDEETAAQPSPADAASPS
ncbi:type I-E CRISPR-associated protein Cse2/CasB [Streptomyces sp. NPDC046374]|uniref:type I-E CRISPR-associated protein Cse2/CasB n=1 Tax=Streptomyces sp. NPDC046374 TaxID=3154917 RepID=UPI0033F07764